MPKKNKKLPVGKKPVLVLSRQAVAGWLVAIFLISGWMFGIGVLVGRGTSPLKIDINELQKKLRIARNELIKRQQEQVALESDPAKERPELDFYESLKTNGDDTEISKGPSPPLIEEKSIPAPTETSVRPEKKSRKRLTQTPKKVIEPAATAATQPAATSPQQPAAPESTAAAAAKAYTIQVAAFKAAADADKVVAELKQKGFSAYRAIGKVPGKGIWYRVRVGAFDSKAEAAGTIAKLKKAGKKPIIVDK